MNEASSENKVISDFSLNEYWQKIPVLIRAICSGTAVYGIGTIMWLLIISVIQIPLSFLLMFFVFWIYLLYFNGSWGPKFTIESRKSNFRLVKLPNILWTWSLLGTVVVVVIIQAIMVLTFRFIEFPSEAFDLGYDFSQYPFWAVFSFVIFAALAAGIFEEVGFRGYMQVPLEKRYGSGIAIGIVSILFTIFHFNQVWAPSAIVILLAASFLFGMLANFTNSLIPGIAAHVITDIIAYSYWWSGLAGEHKLETIFATGIDLHFTFWVLILVIFLIGFVVISRKILSNNQKN